VESLFVVVLPLLALGYLLRRFEVYGDDAAKILGDFVIYVPLPAVILLKVPFLQLDGELAVLAIMPWIMLAVSAGLVLMASRWFGWSRSVTGSLLLVVPLGNTSFLGIPMVIAFFGESAVPHAVLYDQLGTFLALATYGAFVLAAYAGKGKPTVAGVARRIAVFPPFLALVAAFALRGVEYPAPVRLALESIGASLVPVIMVSVGSRIRLAPGRRVAGPLAFGLSVKLIVAPALAWTLCWVAGLDGEPSRIAVFEAGMPSMITAGILAIQADLEGELAAAMVGPGMLVSFATLSVVAAVL
jgi:malate permease and related proteins